MSDTDTRRFVPSLSLDPAVTVAASVPAEVDAVGHLVGREDDVPADVGLDRAALTAHGFAGEVGESLLVPTPGGPTRIVVGIGSGAGADLRDVGAAFARAAGKLPVLALVVDPVLGDEPGPAAEALVEGALLARYNYPALKAEAPGVPVAALTLVSSSGSDAASAGARRGTVLAGATALARDLANTPHNHLSATALAELAAEIGPERGLTVEVFGPDELREMRMAGLLAVNAGSVEEPRMIRLRYEPESPTGNLALVGKGIMYDAGGISIKPSDPIHAQMKNDMSGAAAILAAMAVLRDLGCSTRVTGYLMCTDNMPSGSATALGDVITYRDGTTVEVLDTDAEGRLVLADALILAREEGVDGVIDLATLTGSAMRALGSDMSALFGNDRSMLDQVESAATASGEQVWELPLHQPYRRDIDSLTADMMNCAPIGKPDAIIAALYLAHFVGDVPWAHVDMCGPAQSADSRGLQVPGCSGWGTRLLAHAALSFVPPTSA